MSALVALAVGVAGLLWAWQRQPHRRRTLLGIVALTGLTFQLFHVLEHVVQAAAWLLEPGRPPFLTPWAVAGRDILAVGGRTTLGEELLHLAGNAIFLVGLAGLAASTRRPVTGSVRSLRLALLVQGAHVVEHLVLTVTTAATGRAVGVTSLVGLLPPGPVLWTVRPAAHLGLNLLATALAVAAIVESATFSPPVDPRGRGSRARRRLRAATR